MSQLALPDRLARPVDAIKRRAFEAQFRRGIQTVDTPLTHIGSKWGGWNIPAGVVDSSWVCYCVGAGGDISFDLGLIRDYGAGVRCFDPFELFGHDAVQKAGDDRRFSFHEVAISAADGPVRMYGRQDEVEGAVSAANIYRTRQSFEKPGRTLRSMMAEIGDERIDLLKLDIEGSEYDVLESIDPVDLGIRVLCVEFHHTSSAARALRLLTRLSNDYKVVHRSDRSDVTLARL